MGRTKTTAIQRQEYLEALRSSGESVAQWCEYNGMNQATVYHWLREAKNEEANKVLMQNATEVQPTEQNQVQWLSVTAKKITFEAEIRVQIGNFVVITPDGFNQETLGLVCQTLQSIC